MKSTPGLQPLAVVYSMVGLVAILVIGLNLQGADPLAAIAPALIGVGGLVFQWRLAPLAVLAALAAALVLTPRSTSQLNHLVLGGSVALYLLAQYRLFALRRGILPGESESNNQAIPRATDAEPMREISSALLSVVAAAVAALFLWELTALVRPRWSLSRNDWRLELLAWLAAIVVVAVVSTIGYWSWRRQSRDEALLYLRDEFWRQTRGEQRKINRWLAWGRRRAERAGRTIDS